MTRRTVAVVTAGLSQPSSTRLLADRLAAAVRRELSALGSAVDVEVVEVRDHAHDVVNATLTGFAAPDLQRALDTVAGADGVIAVTPTFNASYSGLFKAFFDVLEPDALVDVPVLVAATGGTARHSLALEHAVRPLFAYLRAVVVPTAVFAASEDWASGDAQDALASRIDRAARQLALLVHARDAADALDPFERPTPFSELLTGS
jgi:FMN reductase